MAGWAALWQQIPPAQLEGNLPQNVQLANVLRVLRVLCVRASLLWYEALQQALGVADSALKRVLRRQLLARHAFENKQTGPG
jgi:hypothetical protein